MGFGKKFKKTFHIVNSVINPLYGSTVGISELTGARKKISHHLRKAFRKINPLSSAHSAQSYEQGSYYTPKRLSELMR